MDFSGLVLIIMFLVCGCCPTIFCASVCFLKNLGSDLGQDGSDCKVKKNIFLLLLETVFADD